MYMYMYILYMIDDSIGAGLLRLAKAMFCRLLSMDLGWLSPEHQYVLFFRSNQSRATLVSRKDDLIEKLHLPRCIASHKTKSFFNDLPPL